MSSADAILFAAGLGRLRNAFAGVSMADFLGLSMRVRRVGTGKPIWRSRLAPQAPAANQGSPYAAHRTCLPT